MRTITEEQIIDIIEDPDGRVRRAWEAFITLPTMEEKCRFVKRLTSIPTTVSMEQWSGMEIRLTETGTSKCFDAKHFVLNVQDETFFTMILDTLDEVDRHIVEAVSDTALDKDFGSVLGWMFPLDDTQTKVIFKRWRRFIDWVYLHYETIGEKSCWWHDLPDNMLAWAARSILGGIKPSRIGIDAVKHGLAEIDKSGLIVYKSKLGEPDKAVKYSVYDFTADPKGKYKVFGWGGALRLSLSKCFSSDADSEIYHVNKIPEQWELDAGYYVGVKNGK